MDRDTRAELQFILDARYKMWVRSSVKRKELILRKYDQLLYSRFQNRYIYSSMGGYGLAAWTFGIFACCANKKVNGLCFELYPEL